jgi:hypothetical protein
MKFSSNEQGLALVVVVLLMFLMFSAALYLLDFSMTEYRMVNSQKSGLKTYYLAEAGLNEMIWRIKNNSDYKEGFRNDPDWTKTLTRVDPFGEGAGSYTVTIRNSQKGRGEIVATGTTSISGDSAAQRVVKTRIFQALAPSEDGDSTSTVDINNSALLADKEVKISHSDIDINGTIHSNDTVKVNGFGTKVYVKEDLEAAGKFSKSFIADVEVDGKISDSKDHAPPPPELDMPTVSFDKEDPDSFKNKADEIYSEQEFKQLLNDSDGSVMFGDASSSAIIYVTGDVSIRADTDLTIYGALIAEGRIEVGKGSGPVKLFCKGEYTSLSINHIEGEPAGLVAKDDIKFGFCLRSSNVDGVVYAGKRVRIMNFTDSIDINGGVFGREIHIFSVWNDMAMEYNEGIIGDTLYPTEYAPMIKVDHWEEEY